ncbi:MAG: polysaccharide biosynthesis C-terminal domain-containing protein, partial [Bacteroidales bacterium]|nr:polysaccharide biosynthesis C-terminal domain-containing protein [Bacteroidales bacterium]
AQQSTKLIFWISSPLLIIFLLFPSLILGFFGEEFIIGSMALIVLVCGQFINSIVGPVGQIMNMTGYQKVLQYTAIISATMNIMLNYILIPEYGITGAAVATAFSGILWNIMCVIYIYKKLNIKSIYLPFLGKQ